MLAIQTSLQRNIQMFRTQPETEVRNIPMMRANTEDEENLYERMDDAQQRQGMDSFPMDIYNRVIEYTLVNGKYRDAMLFICMANWGMRFSDVVRVRYCHIFDSNGNFKESFTLPNGEKKTSKKNTYYNNEATWKIISLYLSQPYTRRTPYDFLFISESGNAPTTTLKEIEIEEKYGYQIKLTEKHIREAEKQKADLLKLYSHDTICEAEFAEMNMNLKADIDRYNNELFDLQMQIGKYISPTINADKIKIQLGLSYMTVQDMLKRTLQKININTRNRKDKSQQMNCSLKLNTHSLRKTFAQEFVLTGTRLNADGKLDVDPTVLNLLQHKFMHSSMSITNRYNSTEERAFETICKSMNIGLEILNQYV